MKVEVNTEYYEYTHGRRPKGYSGGWAFGDKPNTEMERIYWVYGGHTYTEAKKKAIQWAKAQGFYTIYPQT